MNDLIGCGAINGVEQSLCRLGCIPDHRLPPSIEGLALLDPAEGENKSVRTYYYGKPSPNSSDCCQLQISLRPPQITCCLRAIIICYMIGKLVLSNSRVLRYLISKWDALDRLTSRWPPLSKIRPLRILLQESRSYDEES